MRNVLKKILAQEGIIKKLLSPFFSLYNYYRYRILPEKLFIKNTFKLAFGYELDLKCPKTLNEKIQWMKLYDRTPLHSICADKYAVREYIKDKIGEEYLIPLYFTTKCVNELTPDVLPSIPVILKANHDSGTHFIVKDKKNANWKEIRNYFRKALKKNYYYKTKEWQYKNIVPQIIVEKLLLDEGGNTPNDIKLHCFNGIVEYISIDIDRGTVKHMRNWYDREWNRAPFKWSSFKYGRYTDPSDEQIEKPKLLNKMIELSEELSKPFKYVRIDWYEVLGKLYFGEFTFHHDSGHRPILPKEWDRKLGDKIKIEE